MPIPNEIDPPDRVATRESSWVYFCLVLICTLFVALSAIGITWGLPSRKIDPYLFGGGEAWSGQKIHQLAQADEKLSDARLASTVADVDVDAVSRAPSAGQADTLHHEETKPFLLTGTQEQVARIYLRYRLYTYQPDEMITMMSLAGMKPKEWRFDPRLYQYGGLFIYPVGALIRLCDVLGLIDVRSDLVFYLDNPDEFGKFYVVARAYSAAWGLLGVLVVYALTRRVAENLRVQNSADIDALRSSAPAGLMAALFFYAPARGGMHVARGQASPSGGGSDAPGRLFRGTRIGQLREWQVL